MTEINCFERVELQNPITAVALAFPLLNLTRQIVRESSTPARFEQGGFFGGVVREGTLFLWDNCQTAAGCGGKCVMYDKFGKSDGLQNIVVDMHHRTMGAMPDFKMVRYHSHPLTTEKILRAELGQRASSLIEAVRDELRSGIYASLGITDLDAAINEAYSRQLSLEDIDQTRGRYHLLISPTVYRGRPFSHLNFYDLRAGTEKLIQVRLATSKELAPFRKIERAVNREWKKANFGSEDLLRLSEGELMAAYLKIWNPEMETSVSMHKDRIAVL